MRKSNTCRGMTLIELMVVIAVIGILMALILPQIIAARNKARMNQCMNNLKSLGLGMHNYHSANGTFPIGATGRNGSGYLASGDPRGLINRRTWAFAILPYVESSPIYNQVNFCVGFNDVSNSTAVAIHLWNYVCPADAGANKAIDVGLPTRRFKGNYVVNWGNTHYGQATGSNPFKGPLGTIAFAGAPFGLDIAESISRVTDGTSNTLLMSEIINPDSKYGVSDRRGDLHNDDPNAAMFMGYSPPNSSTSDQLPPLTGSPLCIYPWGNNPPCNTNAPAFNAARSQHRGGVHALIGDGYVKFVTDSVNIQVWRAMSTASGGD